MKRKLLKQMLNEWRSNIWIVIELVIVLLVLQIIFGIMYSIYDMKQPVLDTDIDDIYVADVNQLSEESEGYVAYDSTHSAATDLDMLIAKLRSNPYVEKIGYGTGNAIPYQYNFWGTTISLPGDGKKSFHINDRGMSPEMIEVFQIRGIKGETPSQLADMMRKGYILLSETEFSYEENAPKAAEFVGKDVEMQHEPPVTYHVGALVQPMRRSDYEPLYAGTCYEPIPVNYAKVIALRVKPGTGHKFIESLTIADQQSGNLFLTNLSTLSDKRDICQMDVVQAVRSITACALFVLVMVFLGFLGTFWFRTQQRVPEIAIRKVNGATNRDIYLRFFAEGMILLAVAVVITMPLTIWIVTNLAEIVEMPFDNNAEVAAVIISVVVLVLLIIAGIYAPARKAAAVNPAEALKDM